MDDDTKVRVALLVGLLVWYFIFNNEDQNATVLYWESGFPKNCRAIIKENINGFKNGEFTAEEIINSIDRNCWEFWYSRDIKK